MNKTELANLIFPEIEETILDLEKKFPKRNLKIGALVTRFAPSPTGFLHTGSLFTAMIAHKMAQYSDGVFYIRLEDTDSKREISGSGEALISQLMQFKVIPNEGYLGSKEVGNYGPYKQSERAYIYKVVIKHLIAEGKAYPCFCSSEELEVLRAKQEQEKIVPGYYSSYAKCRDLKVDEAGVKIKAGLPYVIRFRSTGNQMNKIKIHDEIRGDLELSQNDQDIVILKSDGLPTYHFAHVVDDHFMHTNCVTRGEEWLPSLPIHIELFETLGFTKPLYAHLPVIMKLDNGNRRKLSKRKDNEAAVTYFIEDGYPEEALIEYLMTIANSNYEEWKIENPLLRRDDFTISFDKMSLDGALFDIMKLKFISKEILSKMNKHEITSAAKIYAQKYNPDLLKLIEANVAYFESIMNIEREKENPRKDYEKYSDIFPVIKFFYDEHYFELVSGELPFNPSIDKKIIAEVLLDFLLSLKLDVSEEEWFNNLKIIAARHKFAENSKVYKQNKEQYIGHVGDVAEMIRIAVSSSKQSPNLYYVLKILGQEKIAQRINFIIIKKLQ